MRRLGSLVRLISLTSIISAEESKKKCKNDFFVGLISKPYISCGNFAYKPIFYWPV